MTAHATYHVVFAGGGTGGHLFPGIAVAEQLVRELPCVRITFAGNGRAFERRHVSQAGFEYVAVHSCRVPRRPWHIFPFLIKNLWGYRTARRFLAEQNVTVVVGLGGFASAAMGRAAVRHNIPLVLLEQNVMPGRATRWLAKWATFLCASMEGTIVHLDPRCPVLLTGNPLRTAFSQHSHNSPRPLAHQGQGVRAVAPQTASNIDLLLYPHHAVAPAQALLESRSAIGQRPTKQLLILGGSGGARSLNENVPRALAKIGWALSGWRIVHQAGHGNAEATRRLYRTLKVEAVVVPFFPDVASILAQTDLAVCRAGGTTLAELAAMAVPAILLPYPHAADDHQLKNAQWFAASEGCIVVDQRKHHADLPEQLAETLSRLLVDDNECRAMSLAIHSLARPDAAWDVATLVGQLVSSQ